MPVVDLADVRWIHGAADCDRSIDPPIQIVSYDEDTFVLRQSKCVNFEATPRLIVTHSHGRGDHRAGGSDLAMNTGR